MKKIYIHLTILASLMAAVVIFNNDSSNSTDTDLTADTPSSTKASQNTTNTPSNPNSTSKTPNQKIPALQRLRERIAFTSEDPLKIGTTLPIADQQFITTLRKSPRNSQTSLTINSQNLSGTVITNNQNLNSEQWIFAIALDDMEGAILTLQKHPKGDIRGTITNDTGTVAYTIDADQNAQNLSINRVNNNDILCGTAHEKGIAGTLAMPLPQSAEEIGNYQGEDKTLADTADDTDPYQLQSAPGSTRVLYLDFDAETVANTSWNTSKNNGNPINLTASRYNSASQIRRIFRHMAEDLKPFDINVTTDRSVYDAAASSRKMMVIFTEYSSWYGSAGGVAYLNSFGSGNYCCFVFTNNLGSSANAAVAASHEAGHTFGLSHDGTSSLGYYGGHGSGYNSWGSIMGAPYGKRILVWDNGTYADANQFQNDYDLINRYLPYRADDASGTTPLPFASQNTISTIKTFNITSANDAESSDTFTFSTTGGQVTLSAKPTVSLNGQTYGSNLDLIMTIRNSSGNIVAQDLGNNTINASISTNLPTGDYTLTIDTTSIEGSTGYTKYGQTGTYQITGTIPETTGIVASLNELQITTNGKTENRTLTLTTNNGNPVDYSISTSANWISASPASGTINSSTDITISINTQELDAGIYNANINIQNQSSSQNITIPITLNLGSITQTQSLVLDDSGPANIYPSTLDVTGFSGKITRASITLNGLSHTYPSDIKALLVSPAGQKIQLINTTGGSDAVSSINLSFSNQGSTFPTNLSSAGSGNYLPDTKAASADLPSPAPQRPYETQMEALNGHSPNGAWKLYLFDNAGQDSGSLDSWTLFIQTEATSLQTTNYSIDNGPSNTIDFTCTPGITYFLESSSDLTQWSTLQTLNPAATNASVTFTPPNNSENQFFRIREE